MENRFQDTELAFNMVIAKSEYPRSSMIDAVIATLDPGELEQTIAQDRYRHDQLLRQKITYQEAYESRIEDEGNNWHEPNDNSVSLADMSRMSLEADEAHKAINCIPGFEKVTKERKRILALPMQVGATLLATLAIPAGIIGYDALDKISSTNATQTQEEHQSISQRDLVIYETAVGFLGGLAASIGFGGHLARINARRIVRKQNPEQTS